MSYITLGDWHFLFEKKRDKNVGLESWNSPQEKNELSNIQPWTRRQHSEKKEDELKCKLQLAFIGRVNESGFYPNHIRNKLFLLFYFGLGPKFYFYFWLINKMANTTKEFFLKKGF